MKAYPIEMRQRVVEYVNAGGTKAEAMRRYKVGRETVYRWIRLDAEGKLEPKKSWGKWRKIDPQKLRGYVEERRSATLKEMAKHFGVNDVGILRALRRLKITFKKKPQNTASGTKKPARGLWST